jgi:hypothetical protein
VEGRRRFLSESALALGGIALMGTSRDAQAAEKIEISPQYLLGKTFFLPISNDEAYLINFTGTQEKITGAVMLSNKKTKPIPVDGITVNSYLNSVSFRYTDGPVHVGQIALTEKASAARFTKVNANNVGEVLTAHPLDISVSPRIPLDGETLHEWHKTERRLSMLYRYADQYVDAEKLGDDAKKEEWRGKVNEGADYIIRLCKKLGTGIPQEGRYYFDNQIGRAMVYKSRAAPSRAIRQQIFDEGIRTLPQDDVFLILNLKSKYSPDEGL